LVDLSVRLGKVTFANPVFVASGTFGYGTEVTELADIAQLGAIVTKSITLEPREGNPPPRVVETPSGMLNSIGLANIGVERYLREMVPHYETLSTPVIMNIAGTTHTEYCRILERVESVSSNIVGYEVNISCPNVKRGGMEFGVDPDLTARLTESLRKRTERLLIMKLSPNVTDIAAIAVAAERAGADALSAINTVVGMGIDARTRRTQIATVFGGLSGPAIKPVGLAAVYKVHQAVSIPVIGIGGITSGTDVVEYLLAGATAIQVGTANFRDPGIAGRIVRELSDYCKEEKIDKISSLTGALQTGSS
jgi:dihydroorotate dehydrogenase (NAD+) catalytic subunit